MTPPYPAAPPPEPRGTSSGPLRRLVGTGLALTVAVSLAGGAGWPAPRRSTSGWQMTDVPAGLFLFVLGTGLGCLAIAALLTRPARWGAPLAAGVWWLLGLATVAAQLWNDLYYAVLGTTAVGAIIPVFDWLFTFVPALGVALVTRRHGRALQLRAGLGTAVVGVPLLTLGWSLYGADGSLLSGLAAALWSGLLLGVAPVAVALAVTAPPSVVAR